jgi:hypothetical protein
MAALFIYVALLPLLESTYHSQGWILSLAGLLMIALCIGGIVDAYKSRLIFGEDAITQVSIWKEKVLPYSQVKGFTHNDKFLYIIPINDSHPKIKVSSYTENFEDLKTELAGRFTDLDHERYIREEMELLQNEALGTTAEEREIMVQKARKTARLFNILGIADAIWLLVFPAPYELCIDCSILLTAAGFYILYKYRGIIRINEIPKSAYPNITYVLFLSSLGLMVRALSDYNLFRYGLLIALTVPGGILLTVLLWYCSGNLKDRSLMIKSAYYIVILSAFFYGACVQINALQDKSPGRIYFSRILDKRISRGKITTYYLSLTPWGPQKKRDDVEVSKNLYRETSTGETVRVHFRKGYLGFRWFYVTE